MVLASHQLGQESVGDKIANFYKLIRFNEAFVLKFGLVTECHDARTFGK